MLDSKAGWITHRLSLLALARKLDNFLALTQCFLRMIQAACKASTACLVGFIQDQECQSCKVMLVTLQRYFVSCLAMVSCEMVHSPNEVFDSFRWIGCVRSSVTHPARIVQSRYSRYCQFDASFSLGHLGTFAHSWNGWAFEWGRSYACNWHAPKWPWSWSDISNWLFCRCFLLECDQSLFKWMRRVWIHMRRDSHL